MRQAFVAALALSVLVGCTTARVEPEIAVFASAVRSNADRIAPMLEAGLAADRQLALREAARARDIWTFSDACPDVLLARNLDDGQNCIIEKLAVDGNPRSIGAATAIKRRLGVLADYVDALALLADAGSEAAVTNAYAAAVGSLGSLGEASGSDTLTEFVAGLEKNREKADAVVSFAIRTLRYNRLKSVVLKGDASVAEVVRSIQTGMINMNLDPEFSQLAANLNAANDAVLLAAPEIGDDEYRDLLVQLDAAHAQFMAYRQNSIYVQVGLIGSAHVSLAKALRTQSTEDVIAYLESLKSLAAKLEE